MLHYPHINPIAVSLGPLRIHWYGIMYLIGFAGAWWLARRRAARPESSWKAAEVDDFLFYLMLGVILGGRIGYVLFYGLPLWRADWLYPLKIWEGGMSFHGGMLGVIAAAALFARQRGRRVGDVFDFAVPLPGVGLFFGRIGNFINGELWGRPTDLPWGMLVPDPNGGPAVARHPSQL
jgi:phosphatidylglycerol---prolipoprotein diacylglyceryl transferase